MNLVIPITYRRTILLSMEPFKRRAVSIPFDDFLNLQGVFEFKKLVGFWDRLFILVVYQQVIQEGVLAVFLLSTPAPFL